MVELEFPHWLLLSQNELSLISIRGAFTACSFANLMQTNLFCCLTEETEKHVNENSFIGNLAVLKYCMCEQSVGEKETDKKLKPYDTRQNANMMQ